MDLKTPPFVCSNRLWLCLAIVSFALVLAACQQDAENEIAGEVLARVDGVPISAAMVDRYLALRSQTAADAARRRAALQELVRVQAVNNRAVYQQLDEDPVVAAELALSRQQIILNHFTQAFLKERPVTDEELRSAYQATVKRSGRQQLRLQRIRYTGEQAAVQALLELETGRSFDEIANAARAENLPVETLPWVDLSQFPEDYAQVLSETAAGQPVPAPLRDGAGERGGWRIFQIMERRDYQPPPFEQIRTGLEQELRRKKLQEWGERLQSQAEVTWAEGYEPAGGGEASGNKP